MIRPTVIRTALLVLLIVFSGGNVAAQARIAIIIDDLGYRYEDGLRATALPGPVACAILPDSPRADALARAAHANGKEVFLHLPLQANEEDGPQEPGALVLDMTQTEFQRAFDRSFDAVPHIVGVNTHQGSLLTRHPGHMQWLMQAIRHRNGIIFVDSYTTGDSVAMRLAAENEVPALRRDVFLDFELADDAIAREFEKLRRIALKRGYALGIGHPFGETLSVLEREIPRLSDHGIELVSVSELLSENGERITAR